MLGEVTHNRLISSTPIYGPLIIIWLSIRLARTDILRACTLAPCRPYDECFTTRVHS